MDALNASLGAMSPAMDRQTFGAQVVSKTLDFMNSGSTRSAGSDMSQTYNFSKDVLGAYMAGRGTIADLNV